MSLLNLFMLRSINFFVSCLLESSTAPTATSSTSSIRFGQRDSKLFTIEFRSASHFGTILPPRSYSNSCISSPSAASTSSPDPAGCITTTNTRFSLSRRFYVSYQPRCIFFGTCSSTTPQSRNSKLTLPDPSKVHIGTHILDTSFGSRRRTTARTSVGSSGWRTCHQR